jgi:hypothetical protein
MATSKKNVKLASQPWTVSIEAEGDGWRGHEDDAEALSELMNSSREVMGPVISWGGLAGGPGVTATVEAESHLAAAERVLTVFEKTLVELGLAPVRVAHLEVATDAYMDADLNQPPTEYVGLAEVARLLGVSKQRVSELRRRRDFPYPLAELAAGPVWDRVSLNNFTEGWDRRPGRPKKHR